MTSHSAAAATAAYTRSSSSLRPLALAWMSLPAVLAVAAATTGNLLYLWIFPGLWCVVVPLLDTLLPDAESRRVADDETLVEDTGASWCLRLMVAAAYLDVFALTWLVATFTPELHAILAAGLSLAIVFGIVVLNVRHFLPPNDKFDAALAGLATGLLGCAFYRRAIAIEHHRACATSADPTSARMGENFWQYAGRALSGMVTESWHRARRRVADADSFAAAVVASGAAEIVFTVVLYGALSAWAGAPGFGMLTVAWCGACLTVLSAHYIQHYGLLRGKRTDGAYARVTAAHAWDDPHRVASLLTLKACCHAQAHTAPRRSDAHLQCLDESPKLPLGFAGALILALIPPAWFAVMDPRVAHWVDGDLQRVNIDGGAYATLMARYHRPSGP